MLSLDSVGRDEDVRAFEAQVRRGLAGAAPGWVAEPKIDGLGIALLYRRGRLIRGATRGDGQIGEDVTRNLQTSKSIPSTLRGALGRLDELEVRGEVFMPRASFGTLNRALASDEVRQRLAVEGAEPQPTTPEDYAAIIDRDVTMWSELVKAAGIKPE